MIEISVQLCSLSDYHSFLFDIDVLVLKHHFSQTSAYKVLSHVKEKSQLGYVPQGSILGPLLLYIR